MKITLTSPDSLTLDLVKKHLLVEHDDDDVIIQQYMGASLDAVERDTHAHWLKREWASTSFDEGITLNNTLVLTLPVNPKEITLNFVDGSDYVFDEIEWYYCAGSVTVALDNVSLVSSIQNITAVTGFEEVPFLPTQARLQCIGSWYGSREDEVIGTTVNQIPSGALRFINQIIAEVAI